MVLRARIVLPVSRPPIEDGAVLVSGDKILSVGQWADLRSCSSEEIIDLGEAVLMPGLINAHCHLELTSLAGRIPANRSFVQWILSVLRLRQELTEGDLARSWLEGARMLLSSGTTTVANIESAPAILAQVRPESPLRVRSFLELTGVLSRKPATEILDNSLRLVRELSDAENSVGISPHAPYSVPTELLRLISDHISKTPRPFCMHVAESEAERDLFNSGSGELADWLGEYRDIGELAGQSPVRFIHKHGLLNENLVAVHANYIGEEDIKLISENRVHIVHCPQSHEHFGHASFRWNELKKAGVNICLGTDSLASTAPTGGQTPSLDLFDEMRVFSKNFPACSPKEVLEMVTLNPAKALQQKGRLGELAPGASADCVVFNFEGGPAEVFDFLISGPASARKVLFRGEWIR